MSTRWVVGEIVSWKTGSPALKRIGLAAPTTAVKIAKNKRVHLHFIPTSSSRLNLVERFFGLLTEKQLKRGVFTSVKELEASIYDFIARHNESPKPFVWTKSAEAILEKVNRARTVLRNQQTV